MENERPPEKNPNYINSEYNNAPPQNAYQGAMHGDNWMMRGNRPVTKMYEMDTRREAELPGGYGEHTESPGNVPGYDYNGQHGHGGQI